MKKQTYYTALGHFRLKHEHGGETCPVVLVNRREFCMDPQEMTLWTCLNWRFLDLEQARQHYDKLAGEVPMTPLRSFEDCLDRLLVRGLVASGAGETGIDALYDLLGGLYVVPISESFPLRMAAFLKMTLLDGVPWARARTLFRKDHPNEQERQVMALSRQALLSIAELIKCAERGVADVSSDWKLMAALYGDADTTSDNIRDMMRGAKKLEPVTVAVANLYLRRQIVFERV